MKRFLSVFLLLLLVSSKAFSQDYTIAITGIGYGTGTANITVTGPAIGTQGLVTAISGDWAGQTITGLSNPGGFAGNDNLINVGSTGFVNNNGITFTTSSLSVNIYNIINGGFPSAFVDSNATNNPSITSTVTPVSAPTAKAIPSLSEWTQLLLGLMVITMLGWQWRKQKM